MTLNVYSTVLLVVIFGCVTFLTYVGKIPAHTIAALLGMIVGWLLKSGTNTIADARARKTPPASESFPPEESPTAKTGLTREMRSEAVTRAMPPFVPEKTKGESSE